MESFVVTRQGFAPVVDNAFAGLGFSGESAKFSYPMAMFLPGADLSPIEDNVDVIIDALTRWRPKHTRKTLHKPEPLTVAGRDYADASGKMNHLFLQRLQGDGLPLLPPTEERVVATLRGTDFPREHLLGKLLPKGGLATVESLAIAAAMAGCRPAYLPVLIATVEAILDPRVSPTHADQHR